MHVILMREISEILCPNSILKSFFANESIKIVGTTF
jgi:hypothetical protein